ncbi:MAG: glycosyltransferase family 2 protein [Pseudomonadota bacterium]
MKNGQTITTITPARNEAGAIAKVIAAVPDIVDEIIIVDNGSRDTTAELAAQAGATVVSEPIAGYGRACLAGIAAAGTSDILIFLDGDMADDPAKIPDLIAPILANEADLVIGSRPLGGAEPGALTPVQRFGNWLACRLIRLFWDHRYTDLGPFRAIRREALEALRMADRDFGWTVEMQVKAVLYGLKVAEIPVPYRVRIGQSKISGTVKGTILAGTKILWVIFRSAVIEKRR